MSQLFLRTQDSNQQRIIILLISNKRAWQELSAEMAWIFLATWSTQRKLRPGSS